MPQPDRRRPKEFITRAEFREFYGRVKVPLEFYEEMTELGVNELLPQILKDERTRQVLALLAQKRWKRWVRVSVVIGIGYAAVTLIGSVVALAQLLHK